MRLQDGTEYSIPPTYTITDTGASCFIGPEGIIGALYTDMVKNVPSASWDAEYADYEFKCSEAHLLGKFSVLFGG